jgi:hypothetical protein
MLKQLTSMLLGVPVAPPRRPASARPPRTGAKAAVGHAGQGRKGREPSLIVYHGTPSLENARSIMRHGWIVGQGNAHGDGVYTTTDRNLAKQYAGANGYVVRARLYPGKVAQWSTAMDRSFRAWCGTSNCTADLSARTAFLLARGYRTLRAGNVHIVLLRAYRNPAATKFKLKRLRVEAVEHASSGKRAAV